MYVPVVEFVLVNVVSYLCGVGTGLSVCCKYKEKFMSRARSHDNLSSYNHHQNVVPAMPSAPLAEQVAPRPEHTIFIK
jgi:hypothetical protein